MCIVPNQLTVISASQSPAQPVSENEIKTYVVHVHFKSLFRKKKLNLTYRLKKTNIIYFIIRIIQYEMIN